MVRDSSGTDVLVSKNLLVHDSLVFLSFICGADVTFANDIELGTGVIDVLEAHSACVDVDVEAFAAWGEVCTDSV